MHQILTAAYLIAMLAAGWRLYGIGWSRLAKGAAALALLLPVPLLFLGPVLLHPERPFADMLRMIGLSLLLCGILCMGGGWSAARLRARRK